MFPEDIRYLFDYIAVSTPVRIINEPVKIGWQGDTLVLEAHPVLEAPPVDTIDEPVRDAPVPDEPTRDEPTRDEPTTDDAVVEGKDALTYVTEQFIVATAERQGRLDWSLVEAAISRSDGIPVAVGVGIKNAATSAASE